MRDYRDAKTMAQTLRDALSERNASLTHAESLELIAKVFGVRDWNTLSAEIQAGGTPSRTGRRKPKETTSQTISRETMLPVASLRDVVVFPHMTLPIFAGREKTIRGIEHAMQGDCRVFLVAQKERSEEHPGAEGVYKVGVIGTVLSVATSDDGVLMSFVRGHQRAQTVHFAERDDFYVAGTVPIEDEVDDLEKARNLSRELLQEIPTYAKAHEVTFWRIKRPDDSDPSRLADAITAHLPIPLHEKQVLLETANVASRIERLLAILRQGRQAA